MKTIAIILAAGNGNRMNPSASSGQAQPKAFLKLGEKTILERSIEVFEGCEQINEIVVVVPVGYKKDVIGHRQVVGGATRQESTQEALKVLPRDTDVVLIHDAARPFVSENIIKKGIEVCMKYGAVIPVLPIKNTIKRVKSRIVEETLERNELFEVQTPQIFFYDLITEAHTKAKKDGFDGTDDAILVERMGGKVATFEGEESNFKITTPKDLFIAKELINKNKQ